MHRMLVLLLFLAALPGCHTTADEVLQLEADANALRELQTRRFDTRDESKLLRVSAALLQDLGFNLDESEPEVGLLVASKERSAVETDEVVGAIALSVVLSVLSQSHVQMPWDQVQKMRVSVVTRPITDAVSVRVTFQRVVWNNEGQISVLEPLQEPDHYVEFFDRLSKAVFLEAHEL